MKRDRRGKVLGFLVLGGCAALIVFALTRDPRRPRTERLAVAETQIEERAESRRRRRDIALVRQLIEEDLGTRRFAFATVMEATSGKRVLPLEDSDAVHRQLLETLDEALADLTAEMSRPGSPAHQHGRINEVSREFEEGLMEALDARPAFDCGLPQTRDGRALRSGYPDLRVRHRPSDQVFYLDPKVVNDGSWDSTFRTFYFEPKDESLKITDDAVHLLVGIGHDGETGEWGFTGWKIVDLSGVKLKLKPEFQASNRALYRASGEAEE